MIKKRFSEFFIFFSTQKWNNSLHVKLHILGFCLFVRSLLFYFQLLKSAWMCIVANVCLFLFAVSTLIVCTI